MIRVILSEGLCPESKDPVVLWDRPETLRDSSTPHFVLRSE